MKPALIVNADDCNLTPGVTRAILQCHDRGIVTSTTFLINLPIRENEIRYLKKRRKLGVGLHLNITLGNPVSSKESVSKLLGSNGLFRKRSLRGIGSKSLLVQVAKEYENQVTLFRKIFGKKPTHLDTHHQLHDSLPLFTLLRRIAKKHRLPIRRSKLMKSQTKTSVLTTDFCFGDLDPKKHWRRSDLERVLKNLPDGVSEIMCHPGVNDQDLKKLSSFRQGRSIEWRIFRCSGLRNFVRQRDIKLCHYGVL